MNLDQMLDRGWTLDRIAQEVRRQVFAHVLKEERRKRGDVGAKGRVAVRLGVHRNTVTRQIWQKQVLAEDVSRYDGLTAERDPAVSPEEKKLIRRDTKNKLMW